MQTFTLVWVQVLHVPDEAVGWWGLCGGKLCGWGVVWYPVFCVVLCGSFVGVSSVSLCTLTGYNYHPMVIGV